MSDVIIIKMEHDANGKLASYNNNYEVQQYNVWLNSVMCQFRLMSKARFNFIMNALMCRYGNTIKKSEFLPLEVHPKRSEDKNNK